MLTISTGFGDSWFAGTQVRNKTKTYKRRNTNAQTIQSCITLTKRAHKTKQTDVQRPGTDIHRRGPTCQSPSQRRWPKAAKWGRPNHWFSRTWTGTSPGASWSVILPYPLKGGYQCFHIRRWRELTSSTYKRASTHPSQVIPIFHSHTLHGGEVVVGIPLVSLE